MLLPRAVLVGAGSDARILRSRSNLELPPWPMQHKVKRRTNRPYIGRANESVYNAWAAGQSPDLLCMDRKFLYTEQHPSGFKSSDLPHRDGSLIHVKHLEDS